MNRFQASIRIRYWCKKREYRAVTMGHGGQRTRIGLRGKFKAVRITLVRASCNKAGATVCGHLWQQQRRYPKQAIRARYQTLSNFGRLTKMGKLKMLRASFFIFRRRGWFVPMLECIERLWRRSAYALRKENYTTVLTSARLQKLKAFLDWYSSHLCLERRESDILFI